MKIAMSLLSGISYGGVTFFKNFIPALARVDKTNEYHIFVSKNHPLGDTVQQSNFHFHQCLLSNQSVLKRLLWEQLILPGELKKRKIDIVFTAKNSNILLSPCKTVISIRNMEPFYYRTYKNEWKLNVASFVRNLLTKISMNKADEITAPSEFARGYIAEHYPNLEKKLHLVYNGIKMPQGKENFEDSTTAEQKFLLTASKYVTYANQLNLIEGYALLRNRTDSLPQLWMAGGIHDKIYFRKVKKLITDKGLDEKVRILGFLPHDELIKLYSKAFAFVFPSTLEACPQTLIEAMAFGVPIATSKTPPMPEICKDAAIYFDPHDKEDIAEKIDLLLNNEKVRNNLSRAALTRSLFFDPQNTAVKIVEVFNTLNPVWK